VSLSNSINRLINIEYIKQQQKSFKQKITFQKKQTFVQSGENNSEHTVHSGYWIHHTKTIKSRSKWLRGLRRRSAAARLLRLWVRIPPVAWMSVCCDCCVLSCTQRRADHSSRGVLPTVVRRCVWSRNLVVEEALAQCFSTARPRPDIGSRHQLYRAARGSPGICHFSFLSNFHE